MWRAAVRPSRPGILMSRIARSGSQLPDQLDRLVAPARLPDDLVALLLEELLQVEADDGFVFGDHDSGLRHSGSVPEWTCGGRRAGSGQCAGSSAAIRSRSASCSLDQRLDGAAEHVALRGRGRRRGAGPRGPRRRRAASRRPARAGAPPRRPPRGTASCSSVTASSARSFLSRSLASTRRRRRIDSLTAAILRARRPVAPRLG